MITEDRWLTAIFGHPVFRVEGGDEADDPAVEVRTHVAIQSAAFYYAKVPTDRIDVVRVLATAGLYVVDVNVTFGVEAARCPEPPRVSGVTVGGPRPEDREVVLDIAQRSFRYSRFHLDPLVPRALADRIKREWVSSYFAGRRGERLLVGLVDDCPVGFLAILAVPAGGKLVKVIDLVAVSPEHQGLGAGAALVGRFVELAVAESDVLEVGTQIANLPSIRLYRRFGFDLLRSQYVLHMHVRDGRTVSA